MISVVIPTYNEAAVISETLRRASRALEASGEPFELIVVDDSSTDGTAELAESLAPEFPVRVLRRPGRLGLATAVVDGWKLARGDLLAVMDADLQHPPEVLGDLVRALRSPGADVAVASRYMSGGGTSDWPLVRRFASKSATHLAASVLPWTLGNVTDPMSGMFAIRAAALDGVRLDPTGYKILLEVLAKARYQALVEVPYVFDRRGAGSSKLGGRQSFEYLIHLARLAGVTGQMAAWIRYLLVGLSGATIDLAIMYFGAARLGWPLLAAVPLAIELALVSNFFLNETLTFRSCQPREHSNEVGSQGLFSRFFRYQKACAVAALLNALVTLVLAKSRIGLLPAAAAGVIAGGALNFLFNIPNIWRVWGAPLAVAALSSAPRHAGVDTGASRIGGP
jgi:dolichol-phosphate mannosyltransferase